MTATIIDLRDKGQVDLTAYLTGPLHQARLVDLEPGESETFTADVREHTVFVLAGHGTARSGPTSIDLRPEIALTLPLGGTMVISAGRTVLRYFHVSLTVSPAP